MSRARFFAVAAGVSALVAAITPIAAQADGLPVLGIDVGQSGVASGAGDVRYVALAAGRGTVVARVEQRGGRVARYGLLRGRFTIPAVAYDGSASGLAADGRTLVLIRPRVSFPQASTTLAVVDAARLRATRIVTLSGDFSFDAVSPSGSTIYLIQYTSPQDPTRYVVRAYDVAAGRLLREPVVDPRERGEKMRGQPVTRTTSADGRWAFTLYSAARGHLFVHALDTTRRQARCVDLPRLGADHANAAYALRFALSPDGRRLDVRDGGEPVATVDTRTLAVESRDGLGGSGTGRQAFLIGGAAAAAAALGGTALALARRRRQLAVT